MANKLVYGVDLGINNVGWCALRKGPGEMEILGIGTFVFDSPLQDAHDPSEGLKSKIRGEKRRARRTGRRRRQRKMGLYRLLAEHGFLPPRMKDRAQLLCDTDPYRLRAEALDRKLEPFEIGRVLCHLNQRRGFLSPRDLMLWGVTSFGYEDEPEENDAPKEKDEDLGRIKKEIEATQAAMAGYRTVGEFLYDRIKNKLPVRKKQLKMKNGKPTSAQQKAEDQRRFVRTDRHMIEQEFWTIMRAQAKHHSLLTEDFQNRIHDRMFHQRQLAANAATRGRCVFFKEELRMPRASLTAQKFTIAQEVAHLTVIPSEGEAPRALTPQERQTLVTALMDGRNLPWSEVKKTLGLDQTAVFNLEPAKIKVPGKGQSKTKSQSAGTKKELRGSQTVERLRRILGDKWDALGPQAQREIVGEIISIRDWVHERPTQPAALRRMNLFKRKAYGPNQVTFTESEAAGIATVELPEGYLNVSLRAAKRILPHLLRDCVYSEACARAGFDHANPVGELPTLDRLPAPSERDIPHAIVRTSVQSAVRVLNALHREFGKPDAIHIELSRQLAMGAKQREALEQRQKENEKERLRITKDLVAIGIRPTRDNITKVRLWEELGGNALPYEPDVVVSSLGELMKGPYEVDHIVPRSHSLDSSMANLTLCTRDFNIHFKGNKTPWEALQGRPEEWRRVEAHVKSIKSMPLDKRRRILAKERPEDFTGRHLAATGYISAEVLKLAQRMVRNKPDALVVPGRATGDFRKFWGLQDLVPLHPEEQEAKVQWEEYLDRVERGAASPEELGSAQTKGEDTSSDGETNENTKGKGKSAKLEPPTQKQRSNYLHHALDALVVALADRSTLQAMATYYQLRDSQDPRLADKASRSALRKNALPDPDIRRKAAEALEQAAIVHRPDRKPKGQLHKQMPDENVVQDMPPGEPWSCKVIGKHLVKYDHDGKPAQAYPLESNHHLVIWERTEPNKKGEYERMAEVVPMIEAVRRRDAAAAARKYNRDNPDKPPKKVEPVIRKQHPDPGWRFVMALCKGDMVELRDGTIGVVSKFSVGASGSPDIAIWHPYAAAQLGRLSPGNPYLIKRVTSRRDLHLFAYRIVLDPLGRYVYREGPRE